MQFCVESEPAKSSLGENMKIERKEKNVIETFGDFRVEGIVSLDNLHIKRTMILLFNTFSHFAERLTGLLRVLGG